jgi:hypothetical protein
MLKSPIFTGFFLLLFYYVNAQSGQTITGKVSSADTKQPFEKAVVQEKGTSNTVVTDITGSFSITLRQNNATLAFSFVGYATKEVSVAGQQVINITLDASSSTLDEVVVTALGIKREVKTLGYASQQVGCCRNYTGETTQLD